MTVGAYRLPQFELLDLSRRGLRQRAEGDKRGHLKCAKCSRHQAMMSSAVKSPAPGFSVTKACGVSPHFSSGRATTAASITSGCLYSTSSTSSELMFSPPEMMMSFARSLIST